MKLSSSFRDPSGFIFLKDKNLRRQVNQSYKENFDLLINSGLYKSLTESRYLIRHKEKSNSEGLTKESYKVIEPEKIPFISYPYEWSFSQLKDAALLTLKIQKEALKLGQSLKDASAYNIQFLDGKPIFIDTLSFEKYEEGKPWVAYKQFCQHFLAPLALMAHTDVRLSNLLQIYLDGIPLDLASKMLPIKTRLNPSILIHIHLHAKSQLRYSDKSDKDPKKINSFSKNSFLGLIDSLEGSVKGLKWEAKGTEWFDYYNKTNYRDKSFTEKGKIIEEFLKIAKPKAVWDLGGNTGPFSRIASSKGIFTVCFDIDPAAVEINYREVQKQEEEKLLPLVLDLTNPSPGLGWENEERDSLKKRGPVDMAFALALIHHLSISNNLPFANTAEFLSELSRYLIIEFVPKEDSQVQKLLATREDVFPNYDEKNFEKEFSNFFQIKSRNPIKNSKRTLYLLKSKSL